jgi:uncharacterized protein (TIGR02145 family)
LDPTTCFVCEIGYTLQDGACVVDAAPGTTMQNWTGCGALATPAALGFTQGPTLVDARDGKSYEIRKFADGKCWMVDNLRYGGSRDTCAGKATFVGNGALDPSQRFGNVTFGDCRDPAAPGNGVVAAPCLGTTACGYMYNWQAAMQTVSAYHGNSFGAPTMPWRGICPTGWHLPWGGTDNDDQLTTYINDNEFSFLDRANGGTGTNSQSGISYTGFWKPTSQTTVTASDPFKSLYSGYVVSAGALSNQGSNGYWWSSTQNGATYVYNLDVSTSFVNPRNYADKNYGCAVRCIQD